MSGRLWLKTACLIVACALSVQTGGDCSPATTPFPIVFTRTLPPHRTFTHLIVSLYSNAAGNIPGLLWRSDAISIATDATGVIHLCLGGQGDSAGFLPNIPSAYAFVQDVSGIPDADKNTPIALHTIDDAFDITRVPNNSASVIWQSLYPEACRYERTGARAVPAFLPTNTERIASAFLDYARIEAGGAYLGFPRQNLAQALLGIYFPIFGAQQVQAIIANGDGSYDLHDSHAIASVPLTSRVSFATHRRRVGLGVFESFADGKGQLGAGVSIPLGLYLTLTAGEVGTRGTVRPAYGLSAILFGAR